MECKSKTTITKIEHGELVDMLSTMFYGNPIFKADYDLRDKEKYGSSTDTSFEDILASILLNGGEIIVTDTEALDAGESYGSLRHAFKDDAMEYYVTLKDIKEGLARCLDSNDRFLHNAAMSFINDDGEADGEDGDTILQNILFGELVYG